MGTVHHGDTATALGYQLAQATPRLLWKKGAVRIRAIRAGELEAADRGDAIEHRGRVQIEDPATNLRRMAPEDVAKVEALEASIAEQYAEMQRVVTAAWDRGEVLTAGDVASYAVEARQALQKALAGEAA